MSLQQKKAIFSAVFLYNKFNFRNTEIYIFVCVKTELSAISYN